MPTLPRIHAPVHVRPVHPPLQLLPNDRPQILNGPTTYVQPTIPTAVPPVAAELNVAAEAPIAVEPPIATVTPVAAELNVAAEPSIDAELPIAVELTDAAEPSIATELPIAAEPPIVAGSTITDETPLLVERQLAVHPPNIGSAVLVPRRSATEIQPIAGPSSLFNQRLPAYQISHSVPLSSVEEKICSICYEAVVNAIVRPCGHEYFNSRAQRLNRCALFRGTIAVIEPPVELCAPVPCVWHLASVNSCTLLWTYVL